MFREKERDDTVLHIAVEESLRTAVKFICDPTLEIGCHLMTTNNKEMNTPLHVAVKHYNPKVLKTLLQAVQKDMVFGPNILNLTPVQLAVESATLDGKTECLKQLLGHLGHKYTDPTMHNGNGETPLHQACKYLLDQYLKEKKKVLPDSLENDSEELVCKKNDEFKRQQKKRLKQIKNNCHPLLNLLLTHMIDLLPPEMNNLPIGTILHYFALLDYAEGIKTIASRIPRVDPMNGGGGILAKFVPESGLIKGLIDMKNEKGETALHVSSSHKSFSAGRELVRLGADVNARCEETLQTPLHVLLNFEKGECNLEQEDEEEALPLILDLLDYGANPLLSSVHKLDPKGDNAGKRMPLFYATARRNSQVILNHFSRFLSELFKCGVVLAVIGASDFNSGSFLSQIIFKMLVCLRTSELETNYDVWKDSFILLCRTCEDADSLARLIEAAINAGADMIFEKQIVESLKLKTGECTPHIR